MIWELLQETDMYNNTEYQDKIEIRKAFVKNMRAFYEKHGAMDLMECNKLFIGTLLNARPSQEKQPLFPTTKDIQTERQQQFEKGLHARRKDFEDTMSASKPEVPNFSDEVDEPIEQMEALISKTIASRNYEIDKIHREMSENVNPTTFNPTTFKQIKIGKEDGELLVDGLVDLNIMNSIMSNNVAQNNGIIKKVTLNETKNRVHVFIDEELNEKVNPMSKFKILSPILSPILSKTHDDDNYARLFSKMEELNKKFDYIIQKLDDSNSYPGLDDQNHRRGQPNTLQV
jgi:hypothetical protein